MWAFAAYAAVFVFLVGVIAYAGTLAGASPEWIMGGVLVLTGIGAAMASRRRRHRTPNFD